MRATLQRVKKQKMASGQYEWNKTGLAKVYDEKGEFIEFLEVKDNPSPV